MTEQLKEMGMRMADLREVMGYTAVEVAERLGISEEEYLAYESGEKDFSFSTMYNVAKLFNVDVVNLLSGDTAPQLTGCALAKKGQGFKIVKDNQYDYRHLAFTFKDKLADPFMVTVLPNQSDLVLHSHSGQEFNYIVEGTIKFTFGDMSYELEEGDSVYFDSSIPHKEEPMNGKAAKFLAIVIEKN
jgi:transcriptional regulator with XRE-family HTH domain